MLSQPSDPSGGLPQYQPINMPGGYQPPAFNPLPIPREFLQMPNDNYMPHNGSKLGSGLMMLLQGLGHAPGGIDDAEKQLKERLLQAQILAHLSNTNESNTLTPLRANTDIAQAQRDMSTAAQTQALTPAKQTSFVQLGNQRAGAAAANEARANQTNQMTPPKVDLMRAGIGLKNAQADTQRSIQDMDTKHGDLFTAQAGVAGAKEADITAKTPHAVALMDARAKSASAMADVHSQNFRKLAANNDPDARAAMQFAIQSQHELEMADKDPKNAPAHLAASERNWNAYTRFKQAADAKLSQQAPQVPFEPASTPPPTVNPAAAPAAPQGGVPAWQRLLNQ